MHATGRASEAIKMTVKIKSEYLNRLQALHILVYITNELIIKCNREQLYSDVYLSSTEMIQFH